ncbi:winged helix-turn-helix transcriptional regulator [Methanobacterium sp.]|uniref:winged helix-turn-helix transcriptional regulator n=1 Tax=Methanobacterium sp. TaxID=2164 RepID=UPI003C737B8D
MASEIVSENFLPLSETLALINKKWNIELIRDMFFGKKRFKDFKEGRASLSNKVLSNCLKNLEKNGIIEKQISNSNHSTTEYYLTGRGKELNRIIYELVVFALEENFYPVNETLSFLAKKWNTEIIKDIFSGKKHFKEFKEGKPDLSNKVLSECLKNLESNGIIEKRILNSNPFSTEYYLTKLGESLNKFIYELAVFTLNYKNKQFTEEFTSIIKEDFMKTLKINY